MEKAEAEVKATRRTGSCLLNLSLPITLADFINSLLVLFVWRYVEVGGASQSCRPIVQIGQEISHVRLR